MFVSMIIAFGQNIIRFVNIKGYLYQSSNMSSCTESWTFNIDFD